VSDDNNERGFVPPPDDVLEHIWNAAHEFLRALRTVVDVADQYVEEQRVRPRAENSEPHLHRIDIDADTQR
jgi:hypothetical protein